MQVTYLLKYSDLHTIPLGTGRKAQRTQSQARLRVHRWYRNKMAHEMDFWDSGAHGRIYGQSPDAHPQSSQEPWQKWCDREELVVSHERLK